MIDEVKFRGRDYIKLTSESKQMAYDFESRIMAAVDGRGKLRFFKLTY